MPLPSTRQIRKPLLEIISGEAPQNFSINNFLELIAEHFGENLDEMSSGDKTSLKTAINNAKSYLKLHGLISTPSKQTYMITKAGSEVLGLDPEIIDDDFLRSLSETPSLDDEISAPAVPEEPEPVPEPEELPEEPEEPELPELPEPPEESEEPEESPDPFNEPEEPEPEPEDSGDDITLSEPEDYEQEDYEPEEPDPDPEPEPEDDDDYRPEAISQAQAIEDVVARYNSDLADTLLMRAAGIPSDMFETFVIDLLSKMGYNTFKNARYNSDSSGGGMIHGLILDSKSPTPIYIHARKLSPGRTVGKADVRDFADAIADKGGKGIFATTASFSEQAEIYAHDERIMMIDGARLANLMIAHNFCVNVEKVFEVKAIDEDSFNDYE